MRPIKFVLWYLSTGALLTIAFLYLVALDAKMIISYTFLWPLVLMYIVGHSCNFSAAAILALVVVGYWFVIASERNR